MSADSGDIDEHPTVPQADRIQGMIKN